MTHYLRTYEEHQDGRIESLRIYPAGHYGNLPAVGDMISHRLGSRLAHFTVVRRHYIEADTGTKGWAIVVTRTDENPAVKALITAWADDDKL